MRVGVLSPHNSKETKAILNAVRALGHEPVWIRDENVTSWIDDGTVHLSPSVDVLVNRLLVTKSHRKLEDLQLARLYADTTPIVNAPRAVADALHKFRAGAELAAADLPVPDAFFGRSLRTVDDWPEHLPADAAQKPTIGTNGQAMSVVSPSDPVAPTIADGGAFIQEFLETADRAVDVRAYDVDVDVRLDGLWRTVTASVTDRSAMSYPVLLGRDVLESYTLDISQTVEE